MPAELYESSITKRRLIMRDSLAILSLLLGTVVLFAVTLFLFRSFTVHRADLAQRWSDRGRIALQAGKPSEAIADLRTALGYAPGTHAYELLLAEALGAAGDTDGSYDYFMGLWDTEPGNGRINLELARLSAKRNNSSDAVKFYRASVYGTWEGDGVARRAEVRLELARYLVAVRRLAAAREELLIAGGNAPDDYDRDMTIGVLLQEAEDSTDAGTYYQRAVAARPGDPVALSAAGRLAYQTGDFERAHRLLERAQAEDAKVPANADDIAMRNNAGRILELTPSPSLPVRERIARILAARAIAKKRFGSCAAQTPKGYDLPQALQALSERWSGVDGTSNATVLRRDSARQDAAVRLTYDTEIQAEKLCGAASGDDALLLRLATASVANAAAGVSNSAQGTVPHE